MAVRPNLGASRKDGRMVAQEIESIAALDQALAQGRSLQGLRLQDLDLTGHEDELLTRQDVTGLVVLGGRLSPRLDTHLRTHGALIFPNDPSVPVNPYVPRLYRPEDLYAGLETGYDNTPDARAYAWLQTSDAQHDAFASLIRAIHDDSISDAFDEALVDRQVVGVMGGHAVQRGTEGYADAARLGHALATRGVLVATGGGPGAMEAANLGALAPTAAGLETALGRLATVPSFRPSVRDWASLALDIRHDLVGENPSAATDPAALRSIGVPTWFYGHEPPNVFAELIAKYFANAIREDILLARCNGGIVVLPGAAGTVQEIFQVVTRLYYAAEGSDLPPLVLVGEDQWRHQVPVWDTLQALGAGRAMGNAVHLVSTTEDALAVLS